MPALHEAVPSLSTTAARVYALMRNLRHGLISWLIGFKQSAGDHHRTRGVHQCHAHDQDFGQLRRMRAHRHARSLSHNG
jgi:hypothetical protein